MFWAHLVYFLPLVLESAISSSSPGSFYWRMGLRTKVWVLVMLVASEVLLFPGLLNLQSKKIHVCILTCIYTHI